MVLLAVAACEQVEVSVVEVARVEVTPANATVQVNATTRYTAAVLNSSGVPLPGRHVAWRMVDPGVAEVDASGLVRGLAAGTTRVEAVSEGATGSATVTVVARQPTITVAPNSLAFVAFQGGASPAPRTVDITDAQGVPLTGLTAEVAYPAGQPAGWIAATLASTTAPATLTVSVVTGTLPAGTYSATIRIGAAGASNTPQAVQVAFIVQPPPPAIGLGQTSASLATTASGEDPAPLEIAITNTGTGTVTELASSITYAAGQPAGWLAAVLAGSTAPTTLTLVATRGALAVGTYSATVRLTAAAANSPVDLPVTFTVSTSPPGEPTNLQAQPLSASDVRLTWSAAPGAVAWYLIERRPGGAAFGVIDSVAAGTLTYTDTGLDAGTEYTYRVEACNAGGCSGYSNEASATTGVAAPGPPSGLQATAVSQSQVNLAWTASTGTVETYRIERRTASGSFAVIATVGGGTLAHQDTGLDAGTEYTYRVEACNAAGCSGYSNEASATTTSPSTVPGEPADVTATAVSSTEVRVSWTAPGGQSSYLIRMREAGGGPWSAPVTVPGTDTSYTRGGLQPNRQYQFQVAACNAAGCSDYSSPVSATTLAASAAGPGPSAEDGTLPGVRASADRSQVAALHRTSDARRIIVARRRPHRLMARRRQLPSPAALQHAASARLAAVPGEDAVRA
jgi:hypothetical protein